jgi:hypothetical protein
MKSCIKFLPKIFCLWVLLGLGLLAVGCQSAKLPLDTQPTQSQGPGKDFIESIYLNGEKLTAIATRGTVLYTEANGAGHHFSYESFIQKPDIFVFFIFGPGGSPAFRLMLRGDEVEALDYGEKVFVSGPRSELKAGSWALPLEPEELVAFLSGTIGSPPSLVQLTSLRTDPPRSEYLVWLKDSSSPLRLGLDGTEQAPQGAAIRRIETQTAAGAPLIITYDNMASFERRDNQQTVIFPTRLTAEIGRSRQKQKLEIRYEEVVLGLVLPPEKFAQTPPAGFRHQDL